MNKKMGRPSKYNNIETKNVLQELVYLYKRENPTGIIRISDMVRYSKHMNQTNPEAYPPYNKDVWSEYGRNFIEEANEPIRTKITSSDEIPYELPNLTDIVQKYGKNEGKLLEYLLPIERLLHELILEKKSNIETIDTKTSEAEELKEEIKSLKENIKYYEQFILTMSHDSYRKEFEGVLKNQISVNANERNKSAIREVDDLGQFFQLSTTKEELIETNELKETGSRTTALNHWKKLRKS